MTGKDLAALIDSTITLADSRTGETYEAKVWNARLNFGKTQIQTRDADGPWFEPTKIELLSVR